MKAAAPRYNGKKTSLFGAGLVLFIIGLLGFILWNGQLRQAPFDEIISEDALLFAELELNKKSIQELKSLFPGISLAQFFPSSASGDLLESDMEQITPWVGSQVALSIFEKGEFILAAEFRNRSKLELFLSQFKLDSEHFVKEPLGDYMIWTPEFSSQLSLGFLGKRVFFASSKAVLKRTIENTKKIAHNNKYQKILQDMPRSRLFFVFADTQALVPELFPADKWAAEKPLWMTVGSVLSGLGISGIQRDNVIDLRLKFLSMEGLYEDREIPNVAVQTMPELAHLVPKDALFFMNGSDLYAKYLHTKAFLEQLHPQFPIIFDGILRAQSRSIFGDNFDFETDFLSQMRDQYAFFVDIQDQAYPFLNITFLTGFGGFDTEENLKNLNEAIRHAQARFTTKVETVHLPDGTTREELVSVPTSAVQLQEKTWEDHRYFTFEKVEDQAQFSYSFVESFFVFSLREEGLGSIISVHKNLQPSLVENADFRESVLFRYSPSESYGFINMAKLALVLETLLPQSETQNYSTFANFFRTYFRNLTFARKVYPEEIFWDITLFLR